MPRLAYITDHQDQSLLAVGLLLPLSLCWLTDPLVEGIGSGGSSLVLLDWPGTAEAPSDSAEAKPNQTWKPKICSNTRQKRLFCKCFVGCFEGNIVSGLGKKYFESLLRAGRG